MFSSIMEPTRWPPPPMCLKHLFMALFMPDSTLLSAFDGLTDASIVNDQHKVATIWIGCGLNVQTHTRTNLTQTQTQTQYFPLKQDKFSTILQIRHLFCGPQYKHVFVQCVCLPKMHNKDFGVWVFFNILIRGLALASFIDSADYSFHCHQRLKCCHKGNK